MARKPPPADPNKRVWRITPDAPMGEYVQRGAERAAPRPQKLAEPEVVVHGGWIESSFDLLNGVDVVDSSDTLSPDDLQTLFGDDNGEWPDTQFDLP